MMPVLIEVWRADGDIAIRLDSGQTVGGVPNAALTPDGYRDLWRAVQMHRGPTGWRGEVTMRLGDTNVVAFSDATLGEAVDAFFERYEVIDGGCSWESFEGHGRTA